MNDLENRISGFITQVETLLGQNRFQDIVPLLEKERDIHNDAYINRALGIGYLHTRKYILAEDYLKKSIIKANDNWPYTFSQKEFIGLSWSLLGDVLGLQEKLNEGLAAYNTSLSINPEGFINWGNLGHTLNKLCLFDEAIRALTYATQKYPTDVDSWHQLTNSYTCKKDYIKAKQCITQSLNLEPAANKWMILGSIEAELKNFDAAIIANNKAIELNPKQQEPYSNNAYICNTVRDKPEEALNWINVGIQNCPDTEILQFRKAAILAKLGRMEDCWNASNEIVNDYILHLNALSIYYSCSGQTALCIDTTLKSLGPDSRYGYYSGQNYDSSEKAIKVAIKKHIEEKGSRDLIDMLKENMPQFGTILSLVLDMTGDEKEHIQANRDLFQHIIKHTPEVLKSLENTSKNKIQIIADNLISENMYIIKKRNSDTPQYVEELEKEYRVMRCIGSITPKTSKAILLESPYLMERRMNIPSLTEIERKAELGTLESEILQCIDTLVTIHKTPIIKKSLDVFTIEYHDTLDEEKHTVIIPKYDFEQELNRRMINRLGKITPEFLNEYNNLFYGMDLENKFIHSDAYKDNWLQGGYIIDWERPSIGDPLIDVIQLINDTEFSDLNKKELLQYYSNQTKVQENIERKYQTLSIHNALCQIGSKINQRKPEEARQYLEQALQMSPQKMREAIIKYARSSDILKQLI